MRGVRVDQEGGDLGLRLGMQVVPDSRLLLEGVELGSRLVAHLGPCGDNRLAGRFGGLARDEPRRRGDLVGDGVAPRTVEARSDVALAQGDRGGLQGALCAGRGAFV